MQTGDWIGVLIVVMILAGIGLFLSLAPEVPKVVYGPVEVTGSSIVVEATTPSGSPLAGGGREVRVAAELKRAGFVTLHQAIGEAPGPIVGQSLLLAPGSYPELVVSTTEPLSPTGEYFVMLFVDDGDGVYESGIDLPVMSDGKVIKQKFSL